MIIPKEAHSLISNPLNSPAIQAAGLYNSFQMG